MNAIGRSINSALQLSRIGGGVGISLSNLRELEHQSKGMKEPLGVVPVMKLLKIASYSNHWDNAKGLGWFTSTSSTQTSSPFLSTKKENADEKFDEDSPSHLGSSCQTSSTSWRVRMKKCTSSAHTLWNVNTEYHLTTSTSLKIR